MEMWTEVCSKMLGQTKEQKPSIMSSTKTKPQTKKKKIPSQQKKTSAPWSDLPQRIFWFKKVRGLGSSYMMSCPLPLL
jgi:hypothetical protein